MGGRSGPVGARSRPPTLSTDKETASSARRPISGHGTWHGAGWLCDDPVLPHLGGALCGLRRGGDCGRPVVPPPSCLPPRLPSLSSCAFTLQIAPCAILSFSKCTACFVITHYHLGHKTPSRCSATSLTRSSDRKMSVRKYVWVERTHKAKRAQERAGRDLRRE